MESQRLARLRTRRSIKSSISHANELGFRIVDLHQIQVGVEITGWCCALSPIKLWGSGVRYIGVSTTITAAIRKATRKGLRARRLRHESILQEGFW